MQIEMTFDKPVQPSAGATIEEVERVVGVLQVGIWMTAAEIAAQLGLEPTENNKRKVRAVAEAARPGIVSYPNSTGYKLAKLCTQEEWAACLSAWASYRRRIAQTEALYQTAYHNFGRPSA